MSVCIEYKQLNFYSFGFVIVPGCFRSKFMWFVQLLWPYGLVDANLKTQKKKKKSAQLVNHV